MGEIVGVYALVNEGEVTEFSLLSDEQVKVKSWSFGGDITLEKTENPGPAFVFYKRLLREGAQPRDFGRKWDGFMPAVYQPEKKLPELSIQDLLPDFGSYIHDLEWSLQFSPESWADYQANQAAYIADLLCDFGAFPAGIERGQDCIDIAERAAREWVGK